MLVRNVQLDTIDVAVGARIRVRRKEKGLTQQKLAESVRITFQQLQKYERGINRVSASRLHALSEALSVPPAYFFDVPCPPPDATTEILDLFKTLENDEECRRLNTAFLRIKDPGLRRSIISFVDMIAKATRPAG